MLLEIGATALGILVSFFLKDINFLGLNFEFLKTGLIYPDFLIIFLIYFSLHKGEFSGLWIGFFAGLLEDSGLFRFSDAAREFIPVIGVYASVYTIAGYTIGKLNRFIDRTHAIPQAILVLIATFTIRLFVWLLMGLIEDFNHSYAFIGPAIYTAIITPIWFMVLGWLYRFSIEEVQ